MARIAEELNSSCDVNGIIEYIWIDIFENIHVAVVENFDFGRHNIFFVNSPDFNELWLILWLSNPLDEQPNNQAHLQRPFRARLLERQTV
jgi:hypothetical protein